MIWRILVLVASIVVAFFVGNYAFELASSKVYYSSAGWIIIVVLLYGLYKLWRLMILHMLRRLEQTFSDIYPKEEED